MSSLNDTQFSTLDHAANSEAAGCLATHRGGWWYANCGDVILNANPVVWQGLSDVTGAVMMIRPLHGKCGHCTWLRAFNVI